MLITRIELENIKSYRQISVDFRPGTTAISGSNGAGKTTLVEAIGFALFGYLPYNQEQFVREGEKFGKIIVHLIGSDDRPYTVERRCGSGARWLVHDIEANLRLEQRADVQDKLYELFGIDRERPLDSLFRDALGVPQGTFTSIFLEPASKRKQTFDALLQIEDYKTAAENLLQTQHHYKEQMQEKQVEIQRLSYEVRELDEWREQLKAARLQDEQQKEQNVLWSQLLTQHEERAAVLNEQAMHLNILEQRYEASKTKFAHAQDLLHEREQQLQSSESAQRVVQANQNDYRRYQQAQESLKRLNQERQKRDILRSQEAEQKNILTKVDSQIQGWQERLKEVADAKDMVIKLADQVEMQIELEKQRDVAIQQVERYRAVLEEGRRLKQQLKKSNEDQEQLQSKINEIEPLQPLADKLQERADELTQLRIKDSQRADKEKRLLETRKQLQEMQTRREQATLTLRKAERNLEIIEEHRSEAEEMPALQEQERKLSAQINRLQGNIEGYVKSRAQSAGGQCPLLNESCLNIKRRGLISLESFFENLLQSEQVRLERIEINHKAVTERIEQIKKYADALSKLDVYIARRDELATSFQNITDDVVRMEHEIATLEQDLEELRLVNQHMCKAEEAYTQSKQADTRVRELEGLRNHIQQLQEQVKQYETDIQERRREFEALDGSEERKKAIEAELETLNDPRSQSKIHLSIIAQEDHYIQQLQSERQKQRMVLEQLQATQKQLATYETLDTDIKRQEELEQASRTGYQDYLIHAKEALLLTERQKAHRQQMSLTEQAEQAKRKAEQACIKAREAFNQQELAQLKVEIGRLHSELAALAGKMQHHQRFMNDLEQDIATAEQSLTMLEEVQKEYQELEDLHTMTEQFRKLIKEAAPHILKAMLGDISAEANRIFGEIMGDRSAHLSWENDYEIVLRRQSVNRTFAQLSGGEQMSAALSIRLALLKKLSTLNIAFFDEPTQNMDEMRRMNLADQIRRVRGFDQLIVISHDDTFEQGLDSLVRLQKIDGETKLLDEDGPMITEIMQTIEG